MNKKSTIQKLQGTIANFYKKNKRNDLPQRYKNEQNPKNHFAQTTDKTKQSQKSKS